MRYKDGGNLHLDFHGATNITIKYIVETFGVDALHEILFNVGHDVYKSIRENLANDDTSELIEHWTYYFDREKADYQIEEHGNDVVLTVNECPAIKHIKSLGLELADNFCDQTKVINKGLCDGTPYKIATKITGCGSCQQILKKE